MKFIPVIILMILFSCNSKQETVNQIDKVKNIKISTKDNAPKQKVYISNTEIIEIFVDSSSIGIKGKCKIELIKHRVYQNNYVIIKFYTKGRYTTKDPETWMIRNNYSYETDALMGLGSRISDFNNDNFNDITFVSSTAARGANEVRRLFIYNNQKQELISIVNSQDYPNMLYNKELNCIDAFLVHGGCSTVFLKIDGDQLKEFACVQLNDSLTVSTIDKNGKEKIIMKDKSDEESYIRFKNFRPLKEYANL